MFDDLLKRYVIKNIWGSPSKENLFIIKPARLSRMRGAIVKQKVAWSSVALPTRTDTYHVFQIGKISPDILGLGCITSKWVAISEIINTTYLLAYVYGINGIIYPRHECYLKLEKGKNLILAVKKMKQFPGIDESDIYIKFYTNSFYFSTRNTYGVEATQCEHFPISNEADAIAANHKYAIYRDKPGFAWGYKNGVFVNNFNPSEVVSGDVLEVFYDSSVYRVIDLNISELSSFTSDLDNKHKFLLNYPSEDNDTIDYINNIDLYLIKKENANFKGFFIHNHFPDSLRMLTHKDYSVPIAYVNGLAQHHLETLGPVGNLTIKLIVRQGGFKRELISEANRILELYKLPHDKVKDLLTGSGSVVNNWRANTLEKSTYPKLMLKKKPDFDISMIHTMLGYDSIVKAYGDSPIRAELTEGNPVVRLPELLSKDVTVYEFDMQGRLNGFYYHDETDNSHYRCYNATTRYVEVLVGKGGETLDMVRGEYEITPESELNYRSYMCGFYNAKPTGEWVDISNNGVTVPIEGKLKIMADPIYWYPVFISDKTFLSYNLKLNSDNGVYHFNIRDKRPSNDVMVWNVTDIPTRRVDIWLNRKWLVRDVDFFINWPKVVITNKEFLVAGDEQDLTIRAYGFCNEQIELEPSKEVGFVTNGYLSANDKYDIRDDKVLSFFVDGKLRMIDTLSFAEDIVDPFVDNARNGAPYEIKETIVALRDMGYLDTYVMRANARAIDKAIEDYRTENTPQTKLETPNFITEKWHVSSPFMQRIYFALTSRQIPNSLIVGHYSDQTIHDLVSEYLEYLEFDPVKMGHNSQYVEIHTHRHNEIIDVNIHHFNFLARVNKLYMDNKVNLSQQLKVTMPSEEDYL